MGVVVLLLLALAGWLILTGRLQRMTMTDGLMLGLAIVGAIMAAKGQGVIGGGALALAGMHGWRRLATKSRSRRRAQTTAPPRLRTPRRIRKKQFLPKPVRFSALMRRPMRMPFGQPIGG